MNFFFKFLYWIVTTNNSFVFYMHLCDIIKYSLYGFRCFENVLKNLGNSFHAKEFVGVIKYLEILPLEVSTAHAFWNALKNCSIQTTIRVIFHEIKTVKSTIPSVLHKDYTCGPGFSLGSTLSTVLFFFQTLTFRKINGNSRYSEC